jgi:hypothetical protein
MKERRASERFQLELKGRMETLHRDKPVIMEVLTRDISARGAFLNAPESLPEGTRFRLRLTIPNERIKELTGLESLIRVEGQILRVTPTGMAVCFDDQYQILGLKILQRGVNRKSIESEPVRGGDTGFL